MLSLVDFSVAADNWREISHERGGTSSAAQRNGTPGRDGVPPVGWEQTIQALIALRDLGEDWDGDGAAAPSPELLASAIGLAYLLEEGGSDPPTRVVAGTDGAVILEWQFPDGAYGEIELTRPLQGDVLLMEPGQPPRQWTIPNA